MEMNLFSFRINEMKFIIIIIIIYSQRTAKHTIHKINIHTHTVTHRQKQSHSKRRNDNDMQKVHLVRAGDVGH